MTDLTAIDILVKPDQATVTRAKRVNERLRTSVPAGYALDATHQPHITTLQRYVNTADLDLFFDAVGKTIASTDIRTLGYEAVMIRHTDWGIPGQGYAVFLIKPSPQVLDFQSALLTSVSPYVGAHGTPDAFVTDPGEPINDTTMKWVEDFVPNQIGENYIPHISLGFATLDDLETLEREPFESFTVHPTSVAVYQLGNNGNARRELKSWQV
jgi:hypothetical protein